MNNDVFSYSRDDVNALISRNVLFISKLYLLISYPMSFFFLSILVFYSKASIYKEKLYWQLRSHITDYLFISNEVLNDKKYIF